MHFTEKYLSNISKRANSLDERLKILPVSVKKNQVDDLIANQLIDKWCQIVANGDYKKFERRLTWDNLNIDTIRHAIDTTCLKERQYLPRWCKTLNEYLGFVDSAKSDIFAETIKYKKLTNLKQKIPFEEILLPFVLIARERLKKQTNHDYDLLSNTAHANIEHSLLNWLSYICSLSLQSEFSIFRATRSHTISRIIKRSVKDKSDNIYKNFIKTLIDGELLDFFHEYPVLARLVATETDLWVDVFCEFLHYLKSDRAEIQNQFGKGRKLGQITTIQTYLSDRHNDARSVMAITFESGLKIVYKPKNIDIEKSYIDLLAWINEHNFPLPLKLFKIINRPTYGWVEFIETSPCKGDEDTKQFFQRSGTLLCLTYVLGATDLHSENIITCGHHPVIIDAETFMHPWARHFTNSKTAKTIDHLANEEIWNSVISTAILPRWLFGIKNKKYDSTGLGGYRQDNFDQLIGWENINTDKMTLSDKNHETQSNTTRLSSSENVRSSLSANYNEIISGFKKMYQFLTEHHQTLLSQTSPLAALAHQQIRYIFRSTITYTSILEYTLQPQFLRNGIIRSIQIDILSKPLLLLETKPPAWALLKSERQALEKMDIPFFTAYANSDTLKLSTGQDIKEYFIEPSFNRVISHLNQLNNEDLKRQIFLIRVSIYSRISKELHASLPVQNEPLDIYPNIPLKQEDIVEKVITIAKNLQEYAIYLKDSSVTWIVPQYIHEVQSFQLNPMSFSLYDGRSGVAFFFAALEKIIGGNEFRRLALKTLQPLRNDLQKYITTNSGAKLSIGSDIMSSGTIIYAVVCISEFLNEPEFLEDAKRIASLITTELINNDKNFDILLGSAGVILGLLKLYSVCNQTEFLEKAVICGKHLLKNRISSKFGHKTWATLDNKLLTGFSHGAAGIAYALLRLYKITNIVKYLEAAKEAITYENSVFDSRLDNWPDFRHSQKKPRYMCSWCHGATGIGLARVATLDVLDTPEIQRDIKAAIKTTKQYYTEVDHLCCGNLGRIEFLLTTDKKLPQTNLIKLAEQQVTKIILNSEQRGHFEYGHTLNFHPGFFQGISGIGYQLLRLAHPNQLPSVLLLE